MSNRIDEPDLDRFRLLYERDLVAFVRVSRAIVGDRERALEAVHDGFANAIASRGSFRGDGAFEAWVWSAVVNAARQARRKPLVDARLDPKVTLPSTGELRELSPLVASLPERQRLIVFLRYYADLDYRSIATALEVEVGTVSAALSAAHRSLRKSLQEEANHG